MKRLTKSNSLITPMWYGRESKEGLKKILKKRIARLAIFLPSLVKLALAHVFFISSSLLQLNLSLSTHKSSCCQEFLWFNANPLSCAILETCSSLNSNLFSFSHLSVYYLINTIQTLQFFFLRLYIYIYSIFIFIL